VEFTAAVVKEQGVSFAVVLVNSNAASPANRSATQRGAAQLFPGPPIILCSQDSRGVPSYYGRTDIVKFLANISLDRLPWKKYHSRAA
jgi:hypothetical protein